MWWYLTLCMLPVQAGVYIAALVGAVLLLQL
jgi:hypothetical protein